MNNRDAATRASQLAPLTKYRLDTSYRSRGRKSTKPLAPREPSPWLKPENRRITTYPTIKVED